MPFMFSSAILLGHLKMPFSKIKEAILSCDENVLSEQHLRQLESFAPDDKEVYYQMYPSCVLFSGINKKMRNMLSSHLCYFI